MKIFNTDLRKRIDNGEIEENNLACKASTGELIKIGPFSKKVLIALAKSSPKIASKMFDISYERLTKNWHEHMDSSPSDDVAAKETDKLLKEKGFISSEVPKKKLSESVKKAFDSLANGG